MMPLAATFSWDRSIRCGPKGHVISYGNSAGPVPPLDIAILGNKGSLTLTRGTLATYTETREGLLECAGDLFDVVQSGRVKVQIKQRYPLREASEAHRALEARETVGSTVMLP